jgi:uncharacterized iron-regulated protein
MDLANNIGVLVASLNILMGKSTNLAFRQKLGTLLSEVLFPLWDAALKQQLDTTTPQFQAATTQLNNATQAAQAANADLNQTQQAIQAAVNAAKAIDQVVGVVLPILALI